MSSSVPKRERVVVGVDFSPASRHALRWAGRQAVLTDADLDAVHVWQYPHTLPDVIASGVDWVAFEHTRRETLDRLVRETLSEAEAAHVHPKVLRGHASETLLDVAVGADLLVVGSRGLGGFGGMVLGSVSHTITLHANCPVVILRAPES